MPTIDNTSLANLELVIQDIVFRSSRIREWLELEPRLRALETSFGTIYQIVNQGRGVIGKKRMDEINKLWSRCKMTDMEDIKSFSQSAQFINKGLTSKIDDTTNQSVKTWIDDLKELCRKIQNDLDNTSIGTLRNNCEDFQMRLARCIADRRNLLVVEVKELCELTFSLRENLAD
jgi:hypothetical protein